MRTAWITAIGAACFVGGWTALSYLDQDDSKKACVEHVTPDTAEFVEVFPGVSKCVLWGDPDVGPYGAYTRFEPGHKNERHVHSQDLRLVVIRGAYIYGTDAGEIRVRAGEYFFIPGGTPHTSAADDTAGVLFYEMSIGKFDIQPVK
jgi:mannose-6-phosphate isomerase-like protein (cupin superfamily)